MIYVLVPWLLWVKVLQSGQLCQAELSFWDLSSTSWTESTGHMMITPYEYPGPGSHPLVYLLEFVCCYRLESGHSWSRKKVNDTRPKVSHEAHLRLDQLFSKEPSQMWLFYNSVSMAPQINFDVSPEWWLSHVDSPVTPWIWPAGSSVTVAQCKNQSRFCFSSEIFPAPGWPGRSPRARALPFQRPKRRWPRANTGHSEVHSSFLRRARSDHLISSLPTACLIGMIIFKCFFPFFLWDLRTYDGLVDKCSRSSGLKAWRENQDLSTVVCESLGSIPSKNFFPSLYSLPQSWHKQRQLFQHGTETSNDLNDKFS